jgi:MSHA biogenesis protein MshP
MTSRVARLQSMPPCRQRGSALIAALFMIIVVAGLGIVAMRLESDQRQTANLGLLEYRADAAAHAGLEFYTHVIVSSTPDCSPAPPPLSLPLDLNGFAVFISCEQITDPAGNFIYEVTAEARSTAGYGAADFVRRSLQRRIALPTAVTTLPTPGVFE